MLNRYQQLVFILWLESAILCILLVGLYGPGFKWFFWDFLGLRQISELIKPLGKEDKGPPPSRFLFWFVGVYVTVYGISIAYYESSVARLESRASAYFSQISSSECLSEKELLRRGAVIQTEKCPVRPVIYDPVSIAKCLFGERVYLEGVSEEIKATLIARKTNLNNLDLSGCDLSKADLSGANFENSKLNRVNFSESSLVGANLKGACLSRASFKFADLNSASLDMVYSHLGIFDFAKIKKTTFVGSYLKGASFKEAFIQAANFSRANLDGANMSGAILSRSLFSKAIMSYVNMRGVRLNTTGNNIHRFSFRHQGSYYEDYVVETKEKKLSDVLAPEVAKSIALKGAIMDWELYKAVQELNGEIFNLAEDSSKISLLRLGEPIRMFECEFDLPPSLRHYERAQDDYDQEIKESIFRYKH